MTVPTSVIVPALVTAVLLVLTAGAGLVGFRLGRRRGARGARSGRPGGLPGRGGSGPTVAELLARLVRRSQTGIAVINRFGDVVVSNERAESLGAIVDARPERRVAGAVERIVSEVAARERVPAEGDAVSTPWDDTEGVVEVDLSPPTLPPGRAPQSIIAQVRPLGDGFVAVDVTDTSAATRLEAVRRDFVANVGHELKTPVGAMTVLAEAVLDADDPDEVTHFATKILHESRRLGALVVELIALSRLQGADRLPELARVDVDTVLTDAIARVRGSPSAGPISTGQGSASGELPEPDRFQVDDPSGLAVAGDRTLLVTALTNLLENALAYSTDGSPVSVRRRSVGGGSGSGYVEISVIDRGIGIAPEHQQRVFERFFRVDRARSRATGGTGLGLAIVKHVAANHGGEVRLWSEPGVGSTFTLRIPAPGGSEAGPGRTSSPPPASAAAPPAPDAPSPALVPDRPGGTS